MACSLPFHLDVDKVFVDMEEEDDADDDDVEVVEEYEQRVKHGALVAVGVDDVDSMFNCFWLLLMVVFFVWARRK